MTIQVLTIPSDIEQDLIKHAQSLAPIESCGYLAGKNNVVEKFYPMTNIDNSPEHFSFDPKEQFSVVKAARKDGHDLLSVYHSHPASPARLSEEDIRLFNDPNPVYIIVSLVDSVPVLKGFKVKKETEHDIEINQVKLVISEGGKS